MMACTAFLSIFVGMTTWAIKGYISKTVKSLEARFDKFDVALGKLSNGHVSCRNEVVQRLSTLETQLKERKDKFQTLVESIE